MACCSLAGRLPTRTSRWSASGAATRKAARLYTQAMKVLVVGAGLSGMVLAAALKRAGADVDLIEVHAKWDVLGVGISVQGPALRALKSIGLLERCIAAGFGYSQVVNCDSNGGVEGVVELPRLNGAQYPSCVGMMRPALH